MIVGRSSECEAIRRLHRAAEAGRGAARVLRGAPGTGKSTLLRWTAEAASPARVVRTDCFEHDRQRAFSLLSAIVAALSAELALVLTEQAEALRAVLHGSSTGSGDALGLGAALISLLAAGARTRPLVLLVDDAHWADGSSREVVIFAAQRIEHERVLLLLGERDGDPNGFGERLPVLDVVGLSPLDAALLLDRDVETRVAEELARETDGNPLALLEIAAQLTPEQRRGERPLDPVLPIGEVLRRKFLARTAALGPGGTHALLLAAADPRIDRETLLPALEASNIDPAMIDQIVVPGLLRIDRSGAVRFAHPLLREIIYHGADAGDLRRAHEVIAGVIAGTSDIDRRARHLAAAADGPDEDAAAALALAAATAGSRGDGIVAGETWRRAAMLSPDTRMRHERLMSAGSAFFRAGENAGAVLAYDDALALTEDRGRRAEVLLRRAMPAVESAGTRGVGEQLEAFAAELGPSDPRTDLLVGVAGIVAMLRGDFVAARALHRFGPDRGPGPTRTMLSIGRLMTGDRTEIEDVVVYAEQLAAEPEVQFGGHEFVVFALTWSAEYSAASRLVDAMVTRGRSTGAGGRLAFALAARAYLYFRTGHWGPAHADATESLELASDAGRPSALARSLFVLGRIEAGLGDVTSATEHARAAYDLAERLELGALSWHAAATLGFAFLGDGRPVHAIEWFARAHDFARAQEVGLLATNLWGPDLVETYLRCGEKASAGRLVDELERSKPERQGALGHAVFLRCRALVADTDAARDSEAALSLHAEVQAPFEAARTRLCYGERLRRDREVAAAHRNLPIAADEFARLGAVGWHRRAETEAAACARGRTATVAVSRSHALTPQEYRVAIAVAGGATSREAAASLFLSPRTVEYHLAKIYRKLGLRSRIELVRRVADSPDFASGADPLG